MFTRATLENLQSVSVYESVIVLSFSNDVDHDCQVTLRRENGKLKWNLNELSNEDFTEIKAFVKSECGGSWGKWKSAKLLAHYARIEARHAAGVIVDEDESGRIHVSAPRPDGTWFSDQDENRNF